MRASEWVFGFVISFANLHGDFWNIPEMIRVTGICVI